VNFKKKGIQMLTLKATAHSYVASATCEDSYPCWQDFVDLGNTTTWSDHDFNHCYRFDLVRMDDDGNWYDSDETKYPLALILNFVHQRKGTTSSDIIHNITEEDLPEINAYLTSAWDYLKSQWAEISSEKTVWP
jgi:hypothetical protein